MLYMYISSFAVIRFFVLFVCVRQTKIVLALNFILYIRAAHCLVDFLLLFLIRGISHTLGRRKSEKIKHTLRLTYMLQLFIYNCVFIRWNWFCIHMRHLCFLWMYANIGRFWDRPAGGIENVILDLSLDVPLSIRRFVFLLPIFKSDRYWKWLRSHHLLNHHFLLMMITMTIYPSLAAWSIHSSGYRKNNNPWRTGMANLSIIIAEWFAFAI